MLPPSFLPSWMTRQARAHSSLVREPLSPRPLLRGTSSLGMPPERTQRRPLSSQPSPPQPPPFSTTRPERRLKRRVPCVSPAPPPPQPSREDLLLKPRGLCMTTRPIMWESAPPRRLSPLTSRARSPRRPPEPPPTSPPLPSALSPHPPSPSRATPTQDFGPLPPTPLTSRPRGVSVSGSILAASSASERHLPTPDSRPLEKW